MKNNQSILLMFHKYLAGMCVHHMKNDQGSYSLVQLLTFTHENMNSDARQDGDQIKKVIRSTITRN